MRYLPYSQISIEPNSLSSCTIMFWGKDKSDGDKDEVPHGREEARPESLKSQIPRQKLSRDLQKLVDREDDYYDELYGP